LAVLNVNSCERKFTFDLPERDGDVTFIG
jgi:hypothetical protein